MRGLSEQTEQRLRRSPFCDVPILALTEKEIAVALSANHCTLVGAR